MNTSFVALRNNEVRRTAGWLQRHNVISAFRECGLRQCQGEVEAREAVATVPLFNGRVVVAFFLHTDGWEVNATHVQIRHGVREVWVTVGDHTIAYGTNHDFVGVKN